MFLLVCDCVVGIVALLMMMMMMIGNLSFVCIPKQLSRKVSKNASDYLCSRRTLPKVEKEKENELSGGILSLKKQHYNIATKGETSVVLFYIEFCVILTNPLQLLDNLNRPRR